MKYRMGWKRMVVTPEEVVLCSRPSKVFGFGENTDSLYHMAIDILQSKRLIEERGANLFAFKRTIDKLVDRETLTKDELKYFTEGITIGQKLGDLDKYIEVANGMSEKYSNIIRENRLVVTDPHTSNIIFTWEEQVAEDNNK